MTSPMLSMMSETGMFTPLPTPAEMGRWDERSTNEFGMKIEMLMENASREALAVLTKETGSVTGKYIVLFAGPGNNGGDAIALARHLLDQGAEPIVLHTVPKSRYKGVSRYHLQLAGRIGVKMKLLGADAKLPLARGKSPDIIVDGLLGTGFKGELRPTYKKLIEQINELKKACFILSIDIPSGINGLSGEPGPIAVQADATVTFEAAKIGLLMPSARSCIGRLHVRAIGIPKRVKAAYSPSTWQITDRILDAFPKCDPDMHKGDAGRVLIIGGSPGLTGAPVLSSLAALRSGSGLVSLACPGALAIEAKAGFPDIMTIPLGQDFRDCGWTSDHPAQLATHIAGSNALVIGPGMGRDESALPFLKALLSMQRPPSVIDADALYWIAKHPELAVFLRDTDILTPHPGEMAALAGSDTPTVQSDRIGTARTFARKTGSIIVLKGASTVLVEPQGGTFLSPLAVPTLAVGGSGDVLAGCIASLLGRGCPPLPAACLGVYWHGLSGTYLERTYPCRGNTAREIADTLPLAMQEKKYATSP